MVVVEKKHIIMIAFLEFYEKSSEHVGTPRHPTPSLRYREKLLHTDADCALRSARFWTPGRRVGRRGKSLGPDLPLNHLSPEAGGISRHNTLA